MTHAIGRSVVSLLLLTTTLAPASANSEGFARCISVDRGSNTLAAFIVNSCNVKLMVGWTDSADCSGKCALPIGPSGRASINQFEGDAWFGACEWPTMPQSTDGFVTYSCAGQHQQGSRQASSRPSTGASRPGSGAAASRPAPARPPAEDQIQWVAPSIRVCPALEDYYPPGSKRREETGRVLVSITINRAGAAVSTEVAQSSGFTQLDTAAQKFAQSCRFNFGTAPPSEGFKSFELPVRFTLLQ